MRPATTANVGLRLPAVQPPTGDLSTDAALRSLLDDRRYFRTVAGIVLTPADDLIAATRMLADGDTVLLLPGQYDLQSTVTVDRRLRIMAHGAIFVGAGFTLLTLTAADVEVHGLQLWRTDRVAGGAAVRIEADACKVSELTVRSASTYGVYVAAGADYVCAQCCKFLQDPARLVGDADVYWANGATFGVVCGTMWSRTAGSFSLDYRAIDLMSEAANGDASMINVR